MKPRFLIILFTVFISLNAFGQANNKVPENVKTAFTSKFPKATKVKWSKENDKEWEAEFKLYGKEYSANFDLDGNWMETEYEINSSEIPSAVKSTLDKDFAGYKIAESEISESSVGKVYEFELKKNGKKAEVSVDVNGKVLEQEQGKEADKDDKD
ncbi:MAG: PepSY-like domain-containing protein [Bacteroidales bacterium]